MYHGAASMGAAPMIFFRLEDGQQTFCHATGIKAWPEDAKSNQQLLRQLEQHKLAMCKAYTFMQLKRMDMNSRIFELQVQRVMTDETGFVRRNTMEPVYNRLIRYLEEAHRDGVIGQGRYTLMLGKARKLQRFLTIKGLSGITASISMPHSSPSSTLPAVANMRRNDAVRTPPWFTT